MAVILYKKGDKDVVSGISCEQLRCEVKQMPYYISIGYVTDINDLKPKPVQTTKKKERKESNTPSLGLDE